MGNNEEHSSEFLRQVYSHLSNSFLENEKLGERRVNLFLAIAGVVLAALGFKEGVFTWLTNTDSTPSGSADILSVLGLGIVLVLGLITLVRLVRRNLITDEYLRGLGRISKYFVEKDPYIIPYLPYPPHENIWRTNKWNQLLSFGRGGLVENVSIINALIVGGICALLVVDSNEHWWSTAIIGVMAGIFTWILQFIYVKHRYDDAKSDRQPALPANVFRANAGVILIDGEGKVLALERCDHKNSWQMPQGGINEDETPLDAAKRELEEETAIMKHIELLDEYPGWLSYELPEPLPKHGRGQVQKWFLFRFTGSHDEIVPRRPEFCAKKWTKLAQLAPETAPFRRSVYEKLAEYFAERLAD